MGNDLFMSHQGNVGTQHYIFQSRSIFNVRVFAAISVVCISCSLGHGCLDVGLGIGQLMVLGIVILLQVDLDVGWLSSLCGYMRGA